MAGAFVAGGAVSGGTAAGLARDAPLGGFPSLSGRGSPVPRDMLLSARSRGIWGRKSVDALASAMVGDQERRGREERKVGRSSGAKCGFRDPTTSKMAGALFWTKPETRYFDLDVVGGSPKFLELAGDDASGSSDRKLVQQVAPLMAWAIQGTVDECMYTCRQRAGEVVRQSGRAPSWST